jgi:hypothetical protein
MREILIRGGETEPSAGDLASAIREIYPPRTEIGASLRPSTRVIPEMASGALDLPPAVIGAADILSLAQLVERMRRIIPHCEVQ